MIKSQKVKLDNFLFPFFLFVNLYNPISIYLSLFLNLIIFLMLIKRRGLNRTKIYKEATLISLIIAIFVIITMIANYNYSNYVFLKYIRNLVVTFLIGNICWNININTKILLNSLGLVFGFHVCFIYLQWAFPSLNSIIAPIFNFDRDISMFEYVTIRNLGLTGSYDFAALISILSIVFFSLLYISKAKNIYFIFALLSFVSCIRISRLAMIFGTIIYFTLMLYVIKRISYKKKLLPIISLFIGLYIVLILILPIIASTTSLFSDSKYNIHGNVSEGYDYGFGTEMELKGDMLFFPDNNLNLFFGYGLEPIDVVTNTDIGYVKIIFNIGLIGLWLILMLHYLLAKDVIRQKHINNTFDKQYKFFIIVYLILILLFNYKLLLMYSRGVYELLLILIFILHSKMLKEDLNYEM